MAVSSVPGAAHLAELARGCAGGRPRPSRPQRLPRQPEPPCGATNAPWAVCASPRAALGLAGRTGGSLACLEAKTNVRRTMASETAPGGSVAAPWGFSRQRQGP